MNKPTFKKAIIILIFTALFFVTSPVSANSKISFEGGAENFVFYRGPNTLTGSDLFSNLKDALPGDTLTEEIEINNTATEYRAVNISLRADPHDENNPLSQEVAERETIASMSDFLSKLTLRIYNGNNLIYESSPNLPGTLEQYILLGTFAPGEGTILRLELSIPKSLGSEYAHRAGEIDWVFLAEEVPDKSTLTNPNTGLFTSTSDFLAPPLLPLYSP